MLSRIRVKTTLVFIAFLLAGRLPGLAQSKGANKYTVRMDQPRQVIWGLGVEIQSDAIGSNNEGLPDKVVAVPNNLIPAERQRFYRDMLKGFRYCRLAMGLYFRGLDATQQRMVERYPNQLDDLKEMMQGSGMEGLSVEYWSPAPYWKSTGSYIGGTLKRFESGFLDAFGNALADDVKYLQQNGLKVSMWGLQNESEHDMELPYSHCVYSPQNYLSAFRVVAPKIRAVNPDILIMADSWNGHVGKTGAALRTDAEALRYVDAWVLHRIGADSHLPIEGRDSLTNPALTLGKPVFTNEYEYLVSQGAYASDERCLNTAQTILNWFTFVDSPTWYWLHALKPTYNAEASGFSLGFWRPEDDNDFTKFNRIRKGHWDYNPQNFHSVAGFLRYMPWDSRRYHVEEDVIRKDNRIMAYRTPQGKLVLVVTNRSATPFTFNIDLDKARRFTGHRYTPKERDLPAGSLSGKTIRPSVPPLAIEFWVEE